MIITYIYWSIVRYQKPKTKPIVPISGITSGSKIHVHCAGPLLYELILLSRLIATYYLVYSLSLTSDNQDTEEEFYQTCEHIFLFRYNIISHIARQNRILYLYPYPKMKGRYISYHIYIHIYGQ